MSERIADGLTHQDNDLLRHARGQVNVAMGRLRDLDADLVKLLDKTDPTDPGRMAHRLARVDRFEEASSPVISEVFSDLNRQTRGDRAALATVAAVGVVLGVRRATGNELRQPGRRDLRKTARANVDGQPPIVWWRTQAAELHRRTVGAVRSAVEADQPHRVVRQLIRGTKANGFQDGTMHTARRHADVLIRTAQAATVNAARLAVMNLNRTGRQWMAQRESACPRCLAWAGGSWDASGNPLPGSPVQMPFPGSPPLHPQCKCTLIPVIGEPAPHLNLEQWLRTQPEAVQLEHLGRSRMEMWMAGDLRLTDMVDPAGNPLTVEQLRARVNNMQLLDARFGRDRPQMRPGIGRQPT